MKETIIEIILKNNNGFPWVNNGSTYLRGYFFKNEGQHINPKDLLSYFYDIKDQQHFIKLLNGINGCYAIIINNKGKLYAATDRIRSVPIFYCIEKNKFFISDEANSLIKIIGRKSNDTLSKYEFQHTGYVTLSDTLFLRISQMQAGEYIFVDKNISPLKILNRRYYKFLHKNQESKHIHSLQPSLHSSINNVFSRLDQSTKNKKLVVPLSGGIDSRLIISNIHKMGRKNVLCFSYGRRGNKESKISQNISNELSYDWYFVDYTKNKWKKWYNSQQMETYLKYAGNASTLPHIQDWPAVWELKEKGLLPNNSVFVPGHTGDFITGSHIPIDISNILNPTKDELIEIIKKEHYKLWNSINSPRYRSINNSIMDKIRTALASYDVSTKEDLANIFEFWEWQERQAKFIANSCKVYEYWGYEWRMPFWDKEFLDFWSTVPLKLRLEGKLYKKYLLDTDYRRLFSSYNYKNFEKKDIKGLIKTMFIGKYFTRIHKRYSAFYNLNYIGFVKYADLISKYRDRYNINSILVLKYLDNIDKGL